MPWAPPWPPPMRPVRSPRSTRTSPSAPRRPPEAQTPTPSSTPAARMTAPPSTITGRGTYHPGLQRFISEDPIGLRGGVNLYAYVANAPTRFTDPRGLHPLKSPLGGLIPHHHVLAESLRAISTATALATVPRLKSSHPRRRKPSKRSVRSSARGFSRSSVTGIGWSVRRVRFRLGLAHRLTTCVKAFYRLTPQCRNCLRSWSPLLTALQTSPAERIPGAGNSEFRFSSSRPEARTAIASRYWGRLGAGMVSAAREALHPTTLDLR